MAPRQWRAAIALGAVFATMNVAYFQAIEYLPIGVASTIELLGPVVVSVAMYWHWRDMAGALMALTGVVLLASPGAELPVAGLVMGVLAAACRAGYVVLNRRVGQLFDDWSGLAVALAVGACLLTPVAAVTHGAAVAHHPRLLLTGLLVALLSSLIPYSLDMTALRRIDVRAFGVLLAMSPAVGACVGFAVLGEHVTVRQCAAIALVVAAGAWSVGSAPGRTGRRPPEPAAAPDPERSPRDAPPEGPGRAGVHRAEKAGIHRPEKD
ncbi:EamA family transporter [Streptomyces misionensis]|uniref:EamA family transporter n=1 Tax=Streptomyces misionensis TaxID=67331 RepID=A0A5C6JRS7_9ACTN|nr:EamA family transporter [Streptomyces misionensis]TWV43432.1 EamA family transporter [Streptomyces misionensis]